ncbi:hypothetical protein [Halocatena pleomorpha]|uniref:Uncharacterized protein n=1 Tax=Halocatena pleomorpha TaxID=1785090 RepID=A0A3P3RKV5_9EURY|nr:hypothetical protein [Halocatena pleomorpha]RRJ34062.1 hypothetical protein EIK79_00740 [Halocatena pleomorpha]
MHNVDLYPTTQAAARELLLGLGFGALALATQGHDSPAFDVLVLGGFGLIASVLGLSCGWIQPLPGDAR